MRVFRLRFFLWILLALPPAAAAETMVPLVVEAGSSLITLANQYCHDREDWRRIAEVNNLHAPYIIHEDTTLLVPAELLLSENFSATVGAVHGEVRLSSAGMAPRPVKTGDKVPPGATVETGENSSLLLIFPDQRFMRIDAESRLRIDSALRIADGSMKIETTLERGSSLNNIKPSTHRNDSFILRTPTALTGVRGTEYRVKLDENGTPHTHVETLRGKVYATAEGVSRTASSGQGIIIPRKQAPGPPVPLSPAPKDFVVMDTDKKQPLRVKLPDGPDKDTLRLTISSDEKRLQMVARYQGKAGETLSVTLPEDGLYYFTLTSINSDGSESLPTLPKAVVVRAPPAAPASMTLADTVILGLLFLCVIL